MKIKIELRKWSRNLPIGVDKEGKVLYKKEYYDEVIIPLVPYMTIRPQNHYETEFYKGKTGFGIFISFLFWNITMERKSYEIKKQIQNKKTPNEKDCLV